MDSKKVYKGLECHRIDDNHRINCADCPYYVDDDNHIRCVNDLHDDAIELLKKQPQIVKCKDCKHQHEYRTGSCPYFTTYGSIAPDEWFCADGRRKERKQKGDTL